jgi:CheY-like chemotaxis protein
MIVMGHIPTIKKNSADDPRLSRAAQAIEIAAQRGASLTRQLLSFARRQRVNPEAVNLHDRIEAIREVLDSGTGSIELAIEIPLDAWWVKVDVSEFEIALVNLVVNARDAMPSGGKITITAHNVNRADDGNLAAGEYVSLSVADTGTGIPEDVLGSVFDPFFTTTGIGRGTGLGLSQVHGFAHQAGGSVEIASTLGHGTIVTLYLPRAPLSAKTQEAPAQTSSELSGSLLLVEDNPDVATATTVLLEQLGYSVQWAGSAEDALKAIEIAKFDVVLSDIVMPGPVDGLGLARAIRSTRPDLPILLATGYSDSVRAEKTDFPILRKPYQLHELSTALSTLTHGREASP